MLPDRVSNPGPLTYESGALPIALRGPATIYGHGHHLEFRMIIFFSLILYNQHINAKYEISLKLAQYLHRKCHLKFFMNGCHGNQSCHAIFIKTSNMSSEHCL